MCCRYVSLARDRAPRSMRLESRWASEPLQRGQEMPADSELILCPQEWVNGIDSL